MNREDIKEFLPHREPMLLVDWTEGNGDGIKATYHVTGEEWFLRGHFPDFPVVPGVILCEMMAQSTCQLYPEVFKDHLVVYRGMDNVRFRGTVRPGDLCEVTCRTIEQKGNLYYCDAQLSVGGKLCCRGKVTIALIPEPQSH